MVVVDHEYAALLVWPLKVSTEANLAAIRVPSEKWKASRCIHHVNKALHRQEKRVIIWFKLAESSSDTGLVLELLIALQLR